MKVVVDAFGCDHPEEFVKGIPEALRQIDDVTIVACGSKEKIEEYLSGEEFDRARLEILNATEVITNSDSPLRALRQKKDSSLVVAYNALKNDDDTVALISAGNTGAVIVGSVLLLGRKEGVEKPALSTILPNVKGTVTCLVDCGASVDCRAVHLLKFAEHGSEFMKKTYGIENPRVALLSVGTEDEKGNALTKETFALLKDSGLNFVGNMEAKTVLSGDVDVIVTDGFAGNVVLKSVEGVSSAVVRIMAGLLKKNAPQGADLSFVKKSMGDFMSMYDFNSLGGAVLLGVNKPIVKAHGSANDKTLVSTVKQAIQMYKGVK